MIIHHYVYVADIGPAIASMDLHMHTRSNISIRRQQEYLRVTQENQAILKRIECKKPCYNRRKLVRMVRMVNGWQASGHAGNVCDY